MKNKSSVISGSINSPQGHQSSAKIKLCLSLIVFLLLTVYCLLPTYTYAADPAVPQIGIKQPKNAGVIIGNAQAPELLTRTLGNAIALIYTFSAIAFVAYFFWGVVDWILAGGDKEGIAKAQRKITQSIVGMIILSLSFVIFAVVGKITGINLTGDITLPSFMNP